MIQAAKWDLQFARPHSAEMRHWQRFRGWKLKILEELEHSGGMTTREVADRIGYSCHATTSRLCEMLRLDLVERIERWGWRITRDGVFLLQLNYNTNTTQLQHNNNTTTTQLQHNVTAPLCFYAATCHIKRNCQDKSYNLKNAKLCENCVHFSPLQGRLAAAAVEMKVEG